MRRLLKFLHTLGAAGLMGGMAALGVLLILASGQSGAASFPLVMEGMARIGAWVILPSMALTIVAGLLAIAATPAYHNAGWAWAKAATGVLLFEGALHVVGPIQEEATRGASALAGGLDPAGAASLFASERNTLWVLLAVSAANIALGIWRRLPRIKVN